MPMNRQERIMRSRTYAGQCVIIALLVIAGGLFHASWAEGVVTAIALAFAILSGGFLVLTLAHFLVCAAAALLDWHDRRREKTEDDEGTPVYRPGLWLTIQSNRTISPKADHLIDFFYLAAFMALGWKRAVLFWFLQWACSLLATTVARLSYQLRWRDLEAAIDEAGAPSPAR